MEGLPTVPHDYEIIGDEYRFAIESWMASSIMETVEPSPTTAYVKMICTLSGRPRWYASRNDAIQPRHGLGASPSCKRFYAATLVSHRCSWTLQSSIDPTLRSRLLS